VAEFRLGDRVNDQRDVSLGVGGWCAGGGRGMVCHQHPGVGSGRAPSTLSVVEVGQGWQQEGVAGVPTRTVSGGTHRAG
jgi:hypothetical protein